MDAQVKCKSAYLSNAGDISWSARASRRVGTAPTWPEPSRTPRDRTSWLYQRRVFNGTTSYLTCSWLTDVINSNGYLLPGAMFDTLAGQGSWVPRTFWCRS